MTLSRRGFFARLGEELAERLPGQAGRASPGTSPPAAQPRDWVRVGPLADFPPGARRTLPELGIEVSSDEVGIGARGAEGRVRPLRLGRDGWVSVQPEGEWPSGAVLNVMTGEKSLKESR